MLSPGLQIAAAAWAFAQPAIPYEFSPGINCIHNSIPAADLLVAEAVERERRPPRGDESAALARVSAIARACADEHAWTPNRTMAGLNYAIAKAMHDRAVAVLRGQGLDAHFLDEVRAELGESGIAALMSSASDGNLDRVGDAVARRLEARGHPIPPGEVTWTRLRREIGRGLVGLAMMISENANFSLQ